MFYEEFTSKEAHEAHDATAHIQAWRAYRATAKTDPVGSSVVTKWRAIA
jgi:quinol monooxygenase YgiN